MDTQTEIESKLEADLFGKELADLLIIIQKMTQNKDVEYTKGDLMSFFVNITVNLLANSGLCYECFQTVLNESLELANEQNLLISHDTSPEHIH